jgi:two-component system, OmpR family, alkaline phosphatase synthesis response regulator PhoP
MESLGVMGPGTGAYRDAHLTLDFQQQVAILDSRPLPLTRKEYELLAQLVAYAGSIVPRAELLMRVWGYGEGIRTRTLDVHIRHLRRKLGVYADEYIETIFGIGHRFQPYSQSRPFQQHCSGPVMAMGA